MKSIEIMQENWLLASEINKLEARLWRTCQRDGLKTILFSSAVRGEGKSTTVAFLATALGMYPDRRILALDFDFRIPALNNFLGLEVKKGLEHALSGDAAIEDVIIETELPSLDVALPSSLGADPALLLRRGQLVRLFDRLRDTYDLILIDSPALLPVADATMLMPVADGVVLAGMAGRSTEAQLKRAREICESVDARVVGLVVSNVEEAAPDYTDYDSDYGYSSYRTDSTPRRGRGTNGAARSRSSAPARRK